MPDEEVDRDFKFPVLLKLISEYVEQYEWEKKNPLTTENFIESKFRLKIVTDLANRIKILNRWLLQISSNPISSFMFSISESSAISFRVTFESED
ncbi:CLUMA_CG004212, isoform A [Clunio marinus]|uniref:CLUMA_CG004212, isoform A n=1 Tax=Clunio marinus TaxID=568069 RepID=A0A1J1HSV5_9DIPT|nr:CLUMA_CG004212, isoform A [Clunio marinus]